MVPKFDNLQKHVGWKKCKVARLGITVGQYFMFTNSQMPRMSDYGLVGVRILLLKWWLVLVKLMRRNASSFNLWPSFGF